ncbi:protein TIC 20-IV, chloroplastic-like [Argentina anserina]|uniref:protein TIC 20-IV, chloroplastic-like n=1 Tax=Argentina anserina TaxID=57926 RepID=UPI0021767699|nr:protein TIC 20-IV, chloroplastic-like [Potentilla anserina]
MATALSCGQSIRLCPSSSSSSTYKHVNFRGPAKLNRVACKFNLKPLPILSPGTPLNTIMPVLPRGLPSLDLSAASSTVPRGSEAGRSQKTSILLRQRKSSALVQVKKKDHSSITIPFPKMTEKLEWWCRTLACLPFLASVLMSEHGFHIIPFAEHYHLFGDLIYYVPGAIKRLPWWFPSAYCILAYFFIVKKKEWSHFFRYHVVMAMLLDTMLQVVGKASEFFPLIHSCGTFGIEYCAAVGFLYILILLECMRCALAGKYAKLPFFSTPALAHTLFTVEGRLRPF